MKTKKPMTDSNGEVRPLNHDDMKQFKPAAQVLSAELFAELVALQKSPAQIPATIRFDVDVLAALKASGKGW